MSLSYTGRRPYAPARLAVSAVGRRERGIGWARRHMTAVSQMLSCLGSVRVTVAYAVVLATIATTLWALGPQVHQTVVSRLSTNLHNLAQGHLGTLVGSAFVTEGADIYVCLPGLVCLLALGELVWRGRRLVATFALGHVGATLIVAAGLAVAIGVGWLPVSATRASDVGISYGAVAVLGAFTAVIPPRWRPSWIGWWLTIAVVSASAADFTAVGHALALILGLVLSLRLSSVMCWTPTRTVLLAVSVAFGYLMITELAMPAAAVAAPAGVLVALIAYGVARWRSQGQHHGALHGPGSPGLGVAGIWIAPPSGHPYREAGRSARRPGALRRRHTARINHTDEPTCHVTKFGTRVVTASR